MNLPDEINVKHQQIRALLEARGARGLWLRRTRNIAWFSAGLDASIPTNSETGVYSLLVTADTRAIYTNNIELTRLRAEDAIDERGFDVVDFPWHSARAPEADGLIHDLDESVEAEIQHLRLVMSDGEKARFRALGQDTAAALEEAIRAAVPSDTEYVIASRLDAACRKRGGLAVVNLIATDERIAQHRHPLPTSKPLEKLVMMVVCMRRHGLIASATRFAHVGRMSPLLEEGQRKIAAIDAAVMVASRPGRTLGAIFADLQAAYAAQGEDGQWHLHHQGGTAGYLGRERIATPGDGTVLRAGQVCAWNPSIVGHKSEDTILVSDDGFEILTQASGLFPQISVDVGGVTVQRPDILIL